MNQEENLNPIGIVNMAAAAVNSGWPPDQSWVKPVADILAKEIAEGKHDDFCKCCGTPEHAEVIAVEYAEAATAVYLPENEKDMTIVIPANLVAAFKTELARIGLDDHKSEEDVHDFMYSLISDWVNYN